jgi:hypothetical protein
MVDVSIVADDDGVLPPQLQYHWGQLLGGRHHDLLAHGGGPHKDDLAQSPAHQGTSRLCVPRDYLNQILGGPCRQQSALYDALVINRRPGCMLRNLQPGPFT